MSGAWLHGFELYSSQHVTTVLFFALIWWGLIRTGVALRGDSEAERWRRGLSVAVLLAWVWANGVQLLPSRYVAAENLPLQICDLEGLLLPLALWTRMRLLYAIAYFWGASFSVVAMLSPDLHSGFAGLDFWTFWVPHANLSGVAIYLIVVEGFRPNWDDCRRSFALTLVYLALILPFDVMTGFNYGYVGPDVPGQPEALALLGPWPWRIPVIVMLSACVFALLQLPWQRAVSVAQKPRSVA